MVKNFFLCTALLGSLVFAQQTHPINTCKAGVGCLAVIGGILLWPSLNCVTSDPVTKTTFDRTQEKDGIVKRIIETTRERKFTTEVVNRVVTTACFKMQVRPGGRFDVLFTCKTVEGRLTCDYQRQFDDLSLEEAHRFKNSMVKEHGDWWLREN
jgi:hypothetical protein